MCVQRLFRHCGVRVEGYMGNFAPTLPFERWDVAVCTLEKANNMLNRFIEDGLLDALGLCARTHTYCSTCAGTIVVDELHTVADRSRGYLLELLLAKVMSLTRQ